MGHLDAGSDQDDFYEIDLMIGETAVFTTRTPFSAGAATPGNALDPELQVVHPDGLTVVGMDMDSAFDGRNAFVTFTAPATGTYTVRVRATAGDGEYLLVSGVQPPIVVAWGINGLGNSNRSGAARIVMQFDQPTTIASADALKLHNHSTATPVNMTPALLPNNGTNTVIWDIGLVALSDGRYTAELPASAATGVGGLPLITTYVFEFHIQSGDLNGDGLVNFDDTAPLSLNFGATGLPYIEGDGNGDGLVNFDDTAPLSVNFGASMAALAYDFGDAPETGTSFPTTLGINGARHVVTGNSLFLGADRDAETDGQPSADASLDGADENGITFGTLERGTNVGVTVDSSGAGFVNAWVDFNQDGDWDDAGERVFTDEPVVAGSNALQIAVPGGATLGSTIARFRLTGTAGYSYSGLAPDGEVEDYQVTIVEASADTPAAASASSSTEPAPERLADRLRLILTPFFTSFDHPSSFFTAGNRRRPSGR